MTESHSPATPTRFVDSNASILFDLLRGIAALLVFVEHGRNLFFVDLPDLTSHRLLLAIPYVLSGAGHQAVVVFFVLSGFFISGTVFRAVERQQWLWTDYLTRRLVRLWVVLIPALLLCLFWDKLGIHLGHAPALYSGNVNNHVLGNVSQLLSPSDFFGNLFFLQAILVPIFGSDGALWSLANEFWYYILFPLGFFALRPATPRLRRFLYGILFFLTAWFVGGMLYSFPIWLAGTLLLLVPPPRFSAPAAQRARILSAFIYPIFFFALAKIHWLPGLASDYILTAVTFGFLWILLSANGRATPTAPSVRASREMARFSYTLYAVHTPLLVFLVALIVGDQRWIPTPAHVVFGLAVLGIALVYAYGLASVTEFRTDAIRRYVERVLHLPDQPSALPSNPNASSAQKPQK